MYTHYYRSSNLALCRVLFFSLSITSPSGFFWRLDFFKVPKSTKIYSKSNSLATSQGHQNIFLLRKGEILLLAVPKIAFFHVVNMLPFSKVKFIIGIN